MEYVPLVPSPVKSEGFFEFPNQVNVNVYICIPKLHLLSAVASFSQNDLCMCVSAGA